MYVDSCYVKIGGVTDIAPLYDWISVEHVDYSNFNFVSFSVMAVCAHSALITTYL
jgi:hypothetical protein